MDPIGAVLGLLGGSEFRRGLLIGAIAAVLLLAERRLSSYWGFAWSAAGVAAIYWTGRPILDPMLAGAGAVAWVPAALAAVAFVAAAGMTSMPDSPLPGAGVAVTALGIWAAVPDTEAISVLLGVTAALVWPWWPLGLASPGRVGAVAVALLLAAAATAGSYTRPGALVGSLGALASLAVFTRRIRISPIVTVILHVTLVVTWTRLAGRGQSAAAALAVGAPISALLIMLAGTIGRIRNPASRHNVARE